MSGLLGLTRGQVHLWYVSTEDAKQRGWLSRYHHLLTVDDHNRHQRFVFEKDRDQFLIARAFVRTTLSRYADIKPEEWKFQINEFGKPSIDAGADSSIRFNLSHSDGLMICGVTVDREIGVDCENSDRKVEIEQLATRVFSQSEQEYFHSVSPARRRKTFFRLWTLKESYIKARGIGMSLPLQHFSFDLARTPQIRISFDGEIQDRPQVWQFSEPAFSKPYFAAVAVNLPQDEPLSIELHAA